VENLLCQIECLRQRMHVIALENGISSAEVLEISCKLDKILNEFYKLSLAKKVVEYKLHLCPPAREYRILHKTVVNE